MAYIGDDIRRLRKGINFRPFAHTLYGPGAASEGILICCSWRLYYIVDDNLYCRPMVVGWPMDEFKAAVAIATCRLCVLYF